MTYNELGVDELLGNFGNNDAIRRVLVIGSGGGADIRALRNRLGSDPLIIGIDIDTKAHLYEDLPNILTLQMDITKQPITGAFFDVVYSFATFEHIFDIGNAWQSMINVLRPGGMLYTAASPLWHSPYGHHKSMFKDHPWIHLKYPSVEGMHDFCIERGLASPDGIDIIHHIRYMLSPLFFNKLSADAYLNLASNLSNIKIQTNRCDLLPVAGLEGELTELTSLGYTMKNLLSVTHRLIGRRT